MVPGMGRMAPDLSLYAYAYSSPYGLGQGLSLILIILVPTATALITVSYNTATISSLLLPGLMSSTWLLYAATMPKGNSAVHRSLQELYACRHSSCHQFCYI